MTIKQLQIKCHSIATDKGFWEGTLNLNEKLMLIVSELGEACEALRRNNRQGISRLWRKDTFEDELADVIIRTLDLAEAEGIDLTSQIDQKLKYNESRPKKHNKKF